MKTKIITSLLLLLLSTTSLLSQEINKSVRNDFCTNALLHYWYGNDTFKAVMIFAARNNGANSIQEIEIQIEDLCNNIQLQEEFFKLVNSKGGSDDFKFLEFHGIGMTAKNAKILTDYVVSKYTVEAKEVVEEKIIEEEKEKTTVVHGISKKAEFVGGNEKMIEYISSSIDKKLIKKYKKEKSVKQFRTTVKFVVDEEGNITVDKVTGIDSTELQTEIISAFENMPKWNSGGVIIGNKFKPKRTLFTIPLTF